MRGLRRRFLAPGIVGLALGLSLSGLAPTVAQDDTTPAVAGEGAPPVVALHRGDCDEPADAPVADLGVLSPFGQGQDAATFWGARSDVAPVLSANVTLDLPFDDVFGEVPHILAVHESVASFGTLIACGELAGAEVDGRVVTGIRPLNASGYAGIAILDEDDAGFLGLGENQTQIAVYLMSELTMAQPAEAAPTEATAAEDQDAATPVVGEEATPAADEADDQAAEDEEAVEPVTVEAVDIDFNPNELSIPANTEATVRVVNNGSILHTFTIDELDINEELDPGAEREITINAEPGEYIYYCTVPGHREAGQEGTLIVE